MKITIKTPDNLEIIIDEGIECTLIKHNIREVRELINEAINQQIKLNTKN